MAIGAFISVGRSLDSALERVKRADELGFEAAYVTHIAGRDSLTVLAAYASVTERIRPRRSMSSPADGWSLASASRTR